MNAGRNVVLVAGLWTCACGPAVEPDPQTDADTSGVTCRNDADCNGLACSVKGNCTNPADLRRVALRWTVNGQAPNATNCMVFDRLTVEFGNALDPSTLSFAPVPCGTGIFAVPNMPRTVDRGSLIAHAVAGFNVEVTGLFDINGEAKVDLVVP
jgi:hypothetical protein